MSEKEEVAWIEAVVNVLLSIMAATFDALATALLGRRKPPLR